MAKKSTWEKRAKKVKKEEHIVLSGKAGRKTSSSKPAAGKGKPTSEADEKKPQTRGGKPASGPKTRSGKSTDAPRSKGGRSGDGPRTRGGNSSDRPRSRGGEGADRPRTRGGDSSEGSRSRGGRSYEGPKFKGGPKGDRFKGQGYKRRDEEDGGDDKFRSRGNANKQFRQGDRKKSYNKFTKDKHFDRPKKKAADDGLVRLNKYLAMAGICSRREADKFIEDGLVSINGKVVTELGVKVKPSDTVEYAGEKVKAEALRYILLNKPKDCITTLNDERDRSTVIGLVKNACKERVFPVGRLDRNTTGLLLLTNDGDLADKLAHPSNEIRKVYHVITDKNVTIADLKKLETGVQLEDGIAKADAALFAGDGSVRNEIGMEIHSGRNRIVRRMFEALGYEVTRLDRAAFAGLSKKGLPRGRWRFLTEKEVGYLKML